MRTPVILVVVERYVDDVEEQCKLMDYSFVIDRDTYLDYPENDARTVVFVSHSSETYGNLVKLLDLDAKPREVLELLRNSCSEYAKDRFYTYYRCR